MSFCDHRSCLEKYSVFSTNQLTICFETSKRVRHHYKITLSCQSSSYPHFRKCKKRKPRIEISDQLHLKYLEVTLEKEINFRQTLARRDSSSCSVDCNSSITDFWLPCEAFSLLYCWYNKWKIVSFYANVFFLSLSVILEVRPRRETMKTVSRG